MSWDSSLPPKPRVWDSDNGNRKVLKWISPHWRSLAKTEWSGEPSGTIRRPAEGLDQGGGWRFASSLKAFPSSPCPQTCTAKSAYKSGRRVSAGEQPLPTPYTPEGDLSDTPFSTSSILSSSITTEERERHWVWDQKTRAPREVTVRGKENKITEGKVRNEMQGIAKCGGGEA